MEPHEHEELVDGLFQQLRTIFEKSDQSIYLYLDDAHKICNDKFASLLGMSSPDEFAKVTESFLDMFVTKKSQKKLISAYENSMEKLVGSAFDVTWKTKNGEEIETTVILVPILYNGHLFALHFISQQKM